MANRVPLIAGNWKMNLDHQQAIALVQKLAWTLNEADFDYKAVDVAVFPPFTDLRTVQTLIDAEKFELEFEVKVDDQLNSGVQVRSHLAIAPGVELQITPEEAGLSPERLQRFFLRGTGANAGRVRVRPDLASMVTFQRLNLLDTAWDLREPFDAIFCRNVMIYFDKPTQRQILSRFVNLMKPDALLFAGHSENFLYVSDALRLRGKTVYELLGHR